MNFITRWLDGVLERANIRVCQKMSEERKDWLFRTKIGAVRTYAYHESKLPEGKIILLVIRDQNGETHIPVKVTHDKKCDTLGTVCYSKMGDYLGVGIWTLINPRIAEIHLEGSLYVYYQYRELYSGDWLTDFTQANTERIR